MPESRTGNRGVALAVLGSLWNFGDLSLCETWTALLWVTSPAPGGFACTMLKFLRYLGADGNSCVLQGFALGCVCVCVRTHACFLHPYVGYASIYMCMHMCVSKCNVRVSTKWSTKIDIINLLT